MYRLLTKSGEATILLDFERAVTRYLWEPWMIEIQRRTETGEYERISRDE